MHTDARPAPCPCGSALPYAACCGRWHAGALHLQAPSAEALMRSRYSAHVLGLADYLRDTWHPQTRPAARLRETSRFVRENGRWWYVDGDVA